VRGRDIFLEPEAMVRSGSALFDHYILATGCGVHSTPTDTPTRHEQRCTTRNILCENFAYL
jgi:hypothetical protein